MAGPLFQFFQILLSKLVKESDDLLLSIIGIGPFQRLKGLIPIDQCQICIHALSEVGPMGIPLGGCEDDML
jgi:hypothetical protein